MNKFEVTVQRTEYRTHVFLVEAEDLDDAVNVGLAASDDYDFSDILVNSTEEEVIAVTPVTLNGQGAGLRGTEGFLMRDPQ